MGGAPPGSREPSMSRAKLTCGGLSVIEHRYICDLCDDPIDAPAEILGVGWAAPGPGPAASAPMIRVPIEDAVRHLCPACTEGVVRLVGESAAVRARQAIRDAAPQNLWIDGTNAVIFRAPDANCPPPTTMTHQTVRSGEGPALDSAPASTDT